MLNTLKMLFSQHSNKKNKQPDIPQTPTALGLHLGGSFTIDSMFLKVTEPNLIIDGASPSQIIQAVGEVKIDNQNRILRFYTDDDGFLQILQYGTDDSGIIEIGLWYIYDTKGISDSKWDNCLKSDVVTSDGRYELEGFCFEKVWQDTAPVPAIEKTYHLNGDITETTQFMMSYARQLPNDDGAELLLISAEEKVNSQFNTVEHELVRSTGINIDRIVFTTN
ncbi:Protein of unknown function [Vibrio xiamenensis]|uniref:DUF2491 domain-containing protein n=1 Tax=Vibrio xiamenensis TaxID=861298 RepID=A0A1G8A1S3_9VIBR|nr:DUF2491 family protein [Vibrio xiamenensis]SDH14430.1 Protein of unknown function [Vibrio xiamenensis]